MDLAFIIQKIQQMPAKAQALLCKNLKLSTPRWSPAGAILMAMEILELLGIPQLFDRLLGEEHTSIEQLKDAYARKEIVVPSPGIILSLLIADMVACPARHTKIYKIEELAHNWQTGPLLGICPTVLNDDRILRCLSLLGSTKGVMDSCLQSLAVSVAEKYGIPLERFFTDTSVLQLSGAFSKAPKVTAGRGSDSMSQLLFGLTIAAGSRIPVAFAVLAGNTNDATTLPTVFESVNRVAQSTPLELTFDRGYVTANNIHFLLEQERECYFIGPLKNEKAGQKFRNLVDYALDTNGFKPINFRSAEERKLKMERGHSAFETEWLVIQEIKPELVPGQKRRPKGSIVRKEATVRCVIYRDGNRANLQGKLRKLKRWQCDDALIEFAGKLNKYRLKTLDACQAKAAELLKAFPEVNDFVTLNLTTNEHNAVIFSWDWDEEAMDQAERYDGIFALLTNYPKKTVSANTLLSRYRERNEIEMDIGGLKGLLDLEEIFLQIPERIDAYVFLKVIAYFILAFLRWFAEKNGQKKVTEGKIREAFGEMGLCQQEVEPFALAHYTVINDNSLTQWFRSAFDLADPTQGVEVINSYIDPDQVIDRWLQRWKEQNPD